MKFKTAKRKEPVTAKDYVNKACILSNTDRLKRWVLNNPDHWYSKKYFSNWLKANDANFSIREK